MYELLAICLLVLTPEAQKNGVTEISITTRQTYKSAKACEAQRELEEKRQNMLCEAMCKPLKKGQQK